MVSEETQRANRVWRESHPTARQRADGEEAISRRYRGVQRIERILVLTSNRDFIGAAKHRACVRRQSEGGTA